MASPIANLGLASGKLTGETLEKLKEADRASRIKPTERKIEKAEKKTEAFSTLTTSVTEVQSTQSLLSDEITYQRRKPLATGGSVEVTVDDGVPVQSLSIDVEQLASNDIYESKGFITKDDLISETDTIMTFFMGKSEHTIKILGGTTLKDLPALLKKQTDGKITANILDTGGVKPYKLIFKSTDTGIASKIHFGSMPDTYEISHENFPMTMSKDELIINGVNIFEEEITIEDMYEMQSVDDKDYTGLELVVKLINDKTKESGVEASLSSTGASIQLSNSSGQSVNLSGNTEVLSNLGFVDGKSLNGAKVNDKDMDFVLTKDLTIKDSSGNDIIIFYEDDTINSIQDIADEINRKYDEGKIEVRASITLYASGEKSLILKVSNESSSDLSINGDAQNLGELGIASNQNTYKKGVSIEEAELDFNLNQDITINDKEGKPITVLSQGDNISSMEDVVDEINDLFDDGLTDIKAYLSETERGRYYITLENVASKEITLGMDSNDLEQIGLDTLSNMGNVESGISKNGTQTISDEFFFNSYAFGSNFKINDVVILGATEKIKDMEDLAKRINDKSSDTDVVARVEKNWDGDYTIKLFNQASQNIIIEGSDQDLEQIGLKDTSTYRTSITGDSVDLSSFMTKDAFKINDEVIIEADEEIDSLTQLLKLINDKKESTGVEAHITQNYNGSEIITLSNPSGKDIKLDGDTASLARIGLSKKSKLGTADSMSILGFKSIKKASDSVFKYNGARVVRSTNKIDDLVVGVHLKLKSKGLTDINVVKDFDELKASIVKFVESYNILGDNITTLTKFDKKAGKIGIFQGISEVSNIVHRLNKEITSYNPKLNIKSLMELGIDISKEGKMSLDESKLDAQLAQNPEDVEKLVRGYVKDFLPTSISSYKMKKEEFKVGFGSSLMLKINGNTFFTKEQEPISIKYNESTKRYDGLLELVKIINKKTDLTNIEADIDKDTGALMIKHIKGYEIHFEGSNKDVATNLGLYGRRAFAVTKNHVKGVFAKVDEYFDRLIDGKDSILRRYSTGLDDNLKNLKEDKEKAIKLLDQRYSTMANKFATYDSMIGKMQNSFKSLEMQIKTSMSPNQS